MLKNGPFLSNWQFKKGAWVAKSPFFIFYEMVTLFLEQFKLKQNLYCAHSQKGTGCHWKQNIEVETGPDM